MELVNQGYAPMEAPNWLSSPHLVDKLPFID